MVDRRLTWRRGGDTNRHQYIIVIDSKGAAVNCSQLTSQVGARAWPGCSFSEFVMINMFTFSAIVILLVMRIDPGSANSRPVADSCGVQVSPCRGLHSSCPALNCLDVLVAQPFASSAMYWIKPSGVHTPFQVFCDMETDGGGWARILIGPPKGNPGYNSLDWFHWVDRQNQLAMFEQSQHLYRFTDLDHTDTSVRLFIHDDRPGYLGNGPCYKEIWCSDHKGFQSVRCKTSINSPWKMARRNEALSEGKPLPEKCANIIGNHVCGVPNGWILWRKGSASYNDGNHPCPVSSTLRVLWLR